MPLPGMPVFISFIALPGGITTVQPSDVRAAENIGGLAEAFATVAGVVAAVNLDGTVQVQIEGLLTLSTAAWDAVTGAVGGLILGHAYFPAPAANGSVTDTAPSGPGQFVTKIGTGISATTLLIEPARPLQNLAGFIVFCTFGGGPLPLGSAVFVSADRTVTAATSNVSLHDAQAIGVIAALDVSSSPIVQIGSVVTLTAAQWAAVTNTLPSMQAGTAYYVDTNALPGHLTAIAPLSGAETQVGVGLSITEFLLAVPFPTRLA